MKSLVHSAVQTILKGNAKITKVWEPPTRASWNESERAYRKESHYGYIYYSWEPVWPYQRAYKDYFDTPILELYGCRTEGILEYVYQQVKHIIYPPISFGTGAFEPFFNGTFSYSVREWCRMMYPNNNINAVPKEVMDKMAETGCFGQGWLDFRGDLTIHADLSMKNEFEFKKHKPNSKRKHYFTHRSQ